MGDKRTKNDLNEYPRQGNEEPKIDLVANVSEKVEQDETNVNQERRVKADDDDAPHLENMANVQGSNKNVKQKRDVRKKV